MGHSFAAMSLAFAGGAAAFAHCLGMCGGFTLALAGSEGDRPLLRQLSWQGGRAFAYVFLGAVAGFSGWFFGGPQVRAGQEAVSVIAGVMMLILAIVQIRSRAAGSATAGPAATFRKLVSPLLSAPTVASSFCLGIVTGFLPCPIVWGFIFLAAGTGTVLAGMETMAALAAGTGLPLLILGVTGSFVSPSLRRRARLWGPAVLFLAGLVTLLRPLPQFHRIMGTVSGSSCCDSRHSEHGGR